MDKSKDMSSDLFAEDYRRIMDTAGGIISLAPQFTIAENSGYFSWEYSPLRAGGGTGTGQPNDK
jgi:hypothetical protein